MIKKHKKKIIALLVSPFLIFFSLNILFPFRVEVPYSQLILAEDGTLIHGFLSQDQKWRVKVDLEEIIPQLKKAIIFKEDKYFYYHFGINPIAILRAAWRNITSAKRTSGASTITMQVSRLLYPKKRTYTNKFLEAFRALQLEWYYSKDEILQLYLNLVPYGGNIEGVKSASLLYFKQMPDKLSLAQITALAVIPNRPTSLALGKNNYQIEQARNKWLRIFEKRGVFNKETIADALAEPLEAYYQAIESKAPHLAIRLHKKYPSTPTVKTTLNVGMQEKIQQIAFNYTRRTKNYNINNTSIMVLDNQTHHVVAYLGSSDFNDEQNSGQVDGNLAYRSPGSTLKPLLYGIAFDEGVLTPKRTINDIPVDFNGYAPQNFNTKFNGKVNVETALAYSLNIPAVKTLNDLGVHKMVQKLEKASFKHISKNKKNLGLSLALGGCGVNLEEMIGLYASFANGGMYYKPLYLSENNEDSLKIGRKILSQEASYMLSEILLKVERPDLPSDYQNSKNVPKIAWKTGTSYGRRDAWSIGFNKKYTIAVWLGNFSGQGVKELTGAGMATPLLFKLFNSIDYNSDNKWIEKPHKIQERLVCSESGQIPAKFCKNRNIDYYIPMISDSRECEHLKYVFVSQDNQTSYCSYCLPKLDYQKALYPNLSSELITYKEENNIRYKKIPLHNSNCTHIFENSAAPKITSPVHLRQYFTQGEVVELVLECQAANDVDTVFWYINDKFIKKSNALAGIFVQLPKGKVKISCSDDKGRNSNIYVLIE